MKGLKYSCRKLYLETEYAKSMIQIKIIFIYLFKTLGTSISNLILKLDGHLYLER